jgi:hypothetical protein
MQFVGKKMIKVAENNDSNNNSTDSQNIITSDKIVIAFGTN